MESMVPNYSDIVKLSIQERIMLVEAIWDSISADKNSNYELSIEQVNILEEQLAEYHKNPSKVKTWDEVKKSILL